MSTLQWEGNINAKRARSNSLDNKPEGAIGEFDYIMTHIKKQCAQGGFKIQLDILWFSNKIHLGELGYKIMQYDKDSYEIEW